MKVMYLLPVLKLCRKKWGGTLTSERGTVGIEGEESVEGVSPSPVDSGDWGGDTVPRGQIKG